MPLLRGLGYVWASPNTLLGLVLGLLCFERPRITNGIVAFDGRPRGFLWVLGTVLRKAGITFGHIVLCDRVLEGRLLIHELHHVRQYERLGPLYIPLYVVIWVFMGYRAHPFERAARLAESEAPG
jgi:hypothetical protein